MSRPEKTRSLPPITTLLTPAERTRVDVLGEGYYSTLHRDNVDDVIRDLKSTKIQAILVSVTCAGSQVSRVASMVREFPRVSAVALLSELDGRTPQAVLALGQSGIRRLVDVRSAAGWRELRGALMADAGDNGQRRTVAQLMIDLAEVSPDCRQFFESLFTCSSHVTNVRALADVHGVLPSTLTSRFLRAGIPAPKRYLSMARLVRAAGLFENSGFSVANVANHLDYSSPQSFGRHVRAALEMTACEFRAHYNGAQMFVQFRKELILPYLKALQTFRPLVPTVVVKRQKHDEPIGNSNYRVTGVDIIVPRAEQEHQRRAQDKRRGGRRP